MCSVMVANEILEVLGEFISDKKVFTAFDVTTETRKRTSDNVRHFEVRNIIGNEFMTNQMVGYNRELCTLDAGVKPQALVYYPDSKQASDHPLVEDIVVDDGDNTDSSDPNIIKVTTEGRFNIPKKILDKVDAIGGSYDFMVNGNLICRSANKDGRVRLSAKKIGISTVKCRLTVDNGSITLESV